MAAIAWNVNWNTGFDEIDAEHKRIIYYMNQLEQIAETRKTDDIRLVMDGLIDYTISHFGYEEELQVRARYPFTKAHRMEHRIFARTVEQFLERANGGEHIVPKLLILLQAWLIRHISEDDQDHAESVQTLRTENREEHADWIAVTIRQLFREHAHVSG